MISISVIFLFVAIAAFFSGSETAIISCSRIRIRHLTRAGDRRASLVEHLLSRPDRLLSTTLVGTNISVVIASTMATGIVALYVDRWISLISTLIMTPLILVFGEIVPKALFRQHANRLTLASIRSINMTFYLLFPVVTISTAITNLILLLLGQSRGSRNPFFTREEMKTLMREGKRYGAIDRQEESMIHRIFGFGELTVDSVIVPREKIAAVELGTPLESVVDVIKKRGFSRIPVYEGGLDNIVGVVNVSQLLTVSPGTPLSRLIKPVIFVQKGKNIEELLTMFQERREHMAIVVNRRGDVLGIVTLEDVIEEIVGEIADEHDRE